MIDLALLDVVFGQQPTSCVLSSYGIIANYFSQGTAVDEAFVAYCDHYGIGYNNNRIVAENNYADYFNNDWQVQNCKGGELILALHRTSMRNYFMVNRGLFYGEFILDVTAQLPYIAAQLHNHSAFLSVGFNNPGGGFHNIVIGKEQAQNSFFIRDPAAPNGVNGTQNINQLIGQRILRDGTLFIGI
jgi:hypothetical protein